MNNKLDRLRLLVDSLVMQAQMETDPERKAKLVESAEICAKRLEQEKGKVNQRKI
jgi:hypothetical protein